MDFRGRGDGFRVGGGGGVVHARLKHLDEKGKAFVGRECGWWSGTLDDGCNVALVEEEEDLVRHGELDECGGGRRDWRTSATAPNTPTNPTSPHKPPQYLARTTYQIIHPAATHVEENTTPTTAKAR